MIAVGQRRTPSVVVGRGRLGNALAAALEAAGASVEVVPGRVAARDAEPVLSAVRRAGPGSILLLAVRDDAVGPVAATIGFATRDLPDRSVALHVSGALGLDVLDPLQAAGFSTGSCHPLQTFTGAAGDPRRFVGSFFAIDGDGPGRDAAELLARSLGGRPFGIPATKRTLYHLAASLGANGLTAVVAAARDALAAAGLPAEEALEALGPLLRASLEEALQRGPEASLTGPAARGDDATLARHRRALLAWDASRAALLEALLREQRRLATKCRAGAGC